MKSIVFAVVVAAAAAVVLAGVAEHDASAPHTLRSAFLEWAESHGKEYSTEAEFNARFAIWREQKAWIDAHNARSDATYTVAINHFADLTSEERKQYFSPFQSELAASRSDRMNHDVRTEEWRARGSPRLPSSADWRPYIQPIATQGQCGSSPYFSALDTVTVNWALKHNKIIPLSVQQIIDCAGPEGDNGCNGGFMTDTFQYIIDNQGICSEQEYPYTDPVQENNCKAQNCTNVVSITSYTSVTPYDEQAMLVACAVGPLATAISANCNAFLYYTGGIIDDPSCTAQADHGIATFGYGTDPTLKNTPYWLLRNQWGPDWGEHGYVRLIRGTNQSAIASFPSYPTI